MGFLSCTEKEYSTPDEISNIDMNVVVKRFDKDFFHTDSSSFDVLKKKYPYFIPRNGANVDSLWTIKKRDTLEQELLEESIKVFPDFEEQTAELNLLFQHIKYNLPEFETPEVVTSTSMVSYRDKILLQNNILLIAVDTYLGQDHKFYAGIPRYISANLRKEQLVSDVAEVYAKQFVQGGNQRSFINQMVYFGKQLYLKDVFMPFKSEASRIGYSDLELEWSKANESEIWSYFVEKDLLFSTDTALSGRFIAPAPFSKFYLELDSESPGMLGRYIGWQIVRSFMKKNDVSLRELITMDGKELFEKSKYKPATVMSKVTSEIKLNIELDENRVPEKLSFTAKDGGVENQDSKAMMLSVWDAEKQESLRIDLWTKDMPVDQMKVFFHQTLVSMSESYQRATQDEKMALTMKDFCDYFAEKLELKK